MSVCPAFPEAGRTISKGYLFVGDVLLSESSMRDHPLTPMRDPSLVRVLQRQCRGKVGLVPQYDVSRGAAAIGDAFASLRQAGFRHAIVDAIDDHNLEAIGEAAADFPLITGGSGIALGLPENFRRQGLIGNSAAADALPPVAGAAVVLSGSCSEATRAQVAYMRERAPLFTIDPIAAAAGRKIAEEALAWATPRLGDRPVLISATAPPEEVAAIQAVVGRERAGALVEETLATIAAGLAEKGARRFVIAGGETAGAIVHALGNYCFYFLLAWLPLFLTKSRGFSIGEMTLLATLGYAGSAGAMYWLLRRHGAREAAYLPFGSLCWRRKSPAVSAKAERPQSSWPMSITSKPSMTAWAMRPVTRF